MFIFINIKKPIFLIFIEWISKTTKFMRQVEIQCRVIFNFFVLYHFCFKLLILHQIAQLLIFIILDFLLINFKWFFVETYKIKKWNNVV
jgi:hypothetical protein